MARTEIIENGIEITYDEKGNAIHCRRRDDSHFAPNEPMSDADFMALFAKFMAESACFSAQMSLILS